MSNAAPETHPEPAPLPGKKVIPPAAERALQEAAERREAYREKEAAQSREFGGRGGKDPVRYGDWEVKGLAADF